MFGKCESGIDLISENLGKIYNSGTYLFMGESGTGKTSFVLQFLLQGLKEGKSCLLVTPGLPRDFVIYAESMGMDISLHILEGRLIIYEYAINKEFSVRQFFDEIAGVLSQHGTSRFALDPFITQNIPSKEIQPFSEQIPAFLERIEKKNIVSFVTLEMPLSQELFILKKKLEVAALGVFLLKATETAEKILVVRKLTGELAQSNKEFHYLIQKGSGIKEFKDVSNLGFSTYFSKDSPEGLAKTVFYSKDNPLGSGKTPVFSKENAFGSGKVTFYSKDSPLESVKAALDKKEAEKEIHNKKIAFKK